MNRLEHDVCRTDTLRMMIVTVKDLNKRRKKLHGH